MKNTLQNRMALCLLAASAIVGLHRAQAPAGCDPQNIVEGDGIEQAITDMQNRMNDALSGLPPIEQVGLAAEMGYAIRACRRMNTEMQSIFQTVRAKVADLEQMSQKKRAEIMAECRVELVKDTTFLKASGLITQADHDTAINAVKGTVKEDITSGVTAGLATIKQVAERRKSLVVDKTLTAVAAEALPDDVLAGDNFRDNVAKIAPRLEKLAKIRGLAEDADTIRRVVAFPVTAEGETAFNDSYSIWDKAAKSAGGAPGTAAPLNTPPVDGQKPIVLF